MTHCNLIRWEKIQSWFLPRINIYITTTHPEATRSPQKGMKRYLGRPVGKGKNWTALITISYHIVAIRV